MSRGGAILVFALLLMLGVVAWVMTRELDAPAPARTTLRPPASEAVARLPEPASNVRPKERYAMTRAGLVDLDPHVPAERQGETIRDYWTEVRGGDSRHAYELSYLLRECDLAREAFERTQDEGIRDLMQPRVRACEGVSAELQGHLQKLLELAASRGDVRAQTSFGLVVPTGEAAATPEEARAFESKAVGYWQAAADRGSAQAMSMLSAVYRSGDWGVPPDPAAALAYHLSATALAPRWADLEMRRAYESRVTLAQRDRAFEMHREIMARCCEAAP